jgi:hypothetical protein
MIFVFFVVWLEIGPFYSWRYIWILVEIDLRLKNCYLGLSFEVVRFKT